MNGPPLPAARNEPPVGVDPIPVLWLCGPSGVGKTSVGWTLFRELVEAGVKAAYVDADQLGMCYPEPLDDPGRYRLQARALAAVVAGFRAAGARCIIVSGVVDPEHGAHRDLLPDIALTVCRLRAEMACIRMRFTGREGPDADMDEILSDAARMERTRFADLVVETTAVSVHDVTRHVRNRLGDWPGATTPGPSPAPTGPDADGPVLLLGGATGVGKSTVGWQVYQSVLGSGRSAAFVDLSQIGFCHPAPSDDPGHQRLRARNLAAVARTFRDAEYLIAVGRIDSQREHQTYTAALPAARVTLCRLHAGREALTERILRLGRGDGWFAPGDPLRGRSEADLLRIADRAVLDAEAMERAVVGDLSVRTDGRDVDDIAAEIVTRVVQPRGLGTVSG